MMTIVIRGPWNVEDHLLILQPWQENFQHFLGPNLRPLYKVVFKEGCKEAVELLEELNYDATAQAIELEAKIFPVWN